MGAESRRMPRRIVAGLTDVVDVMTEETIGHLGNLSVGERKRVEMELQQAKADAEKTRIDAQAAAESEAIRIRTVAAATAEGIRLVNDAIQAGGEAYLRYRQLELVPQIAPAIGEALAHARLVTLSSDTDGAPAATTRQITEVVQTLLAAQLVSRSGLEPAK